MKTWKTLIFLLLVFWATSCSNDLLDDQGTPVANEFKEEGKLKSAIPHMKIAFIGGLSYLDPSLMIDCLSEGSDFMNVISQKKGVQELCKPILDQAVSQILAEKPNLLLIAGELSYKGEKISHEAVAGILKNISEQGIKIFVIPGDQDISNPEARAYNGNGSSSTPTVTNEEFENIYKDFGFNDAISRDPNSLSYLAQPFNKFWIMGIDARGYPIEPWGPIKPETMEWIKYWLARAKEKNITVFALCRNNVMEPWAEAAIWGPGYVIENHENIENTLTDAGLRVIFTANANDITMNSTEENDLYDICDVHLISPPHSYRMMKLEPNSLKIETRHITSINATIPGGVDFLDYSNACYLERISRKLTLMYTRPPFKLPRGDDSEPGTADYYGLHFAKALHTFYAGDEQFPPEEESESQYWPEPYIHVLKSIYTDLPPSDNQCTIDMRKN